jgi:peptide/nickel transport system substrate-binding protein
MRWRVVEATLVSFALCGCRKPAAELVSARTLRIAVPYDVSTLDPHAEDRVTNFALLANLYEPLVTTDAEMAIRPCLAEKWESPDPLTWIFYLRHSVTFHGGRPLRAADVVYSLDRLRRNPDLDIRNYVQNVAEVAAVDDLTIRIHTSAPSAIFLSKLRFVMIIPAGSGPGLGSKVDGTGPYALADWQPGVSMRMKRNERYWGAAPAAREVEFRVNLEPEETLRGLRNQEYQIALCNSKRLEPGPAWLAHYRVVRADNLFVPYLGWDLSGRTTPFSSVTKNPFRDIRVRRAVGLAIDRRRLLAGLSGHATTATQMVPRFVFGFDPELPEMVRDLQQARDLLRDAGLPKGFKVVLHARPVLEEAALLVKRDLAEIGIEVETRLLPNHEFFAQKRKGMPLWLDRWACSGGDASEFLDNFVHSEDPKRSLGAFNYQGYANPDLDRAIERSAEVEKVRDRRSLLQDIMRTTVRDLVLLPLYNDQDVYAIDNALAWQPRNDRYIKVAEIVPVPPR